MADDKVLSRKEDGIGWLIFNNPERRNALTIEMDEAAGKVIEDFAGDPSVRVVIVRGAGDKAFIAGGDFSAYDKQTATEEVRKQTDRIRANTHRLLYTLEKPTIAMIRGYCLGGGIAYAMNCDLRVCSDGAKFGVPVARFGIGYMTEGIRRLLEVVGPSTTKEMLYTAGQYTAQEALALRLVNKVVPDAELESFTRSYADIISGNAPLTTLHAKTAVNELLKDAGDRNLDLIMKRAVAIGASQDNIEGRRAFMEKRKPVFTGR